MKLGKVLITGVLAFGASINAANAAKLTLYCSADDEFCQVMARGFEAETGIDVNMTRKCLSRAFACHVNIDAGLSLKPTGHYLTELIVRTAIQC